MPIFSQKYSHDADEFGEPILAGGTKLTIPALSASGATNADLNLNSINLYKFENGNSAYSGVKSTTSVVD